MAGRNQSLIASTGIEELDRFLGGGLLRHRGYMISGPLHCGKRLLALSIQRASLLRGEYNQYSVYGQSYQTILDDYRATGIDPDKFMDAGLLKIVDYFTAEACAPGEIDQIREKLSPALRKGIIFMPPRRLETELRKYIEEMRAFIMTVGTPGTVIVDSLNERLLQAPAETVLQQWRTLKERMSRQSGLMSLHIYSPLGMEIEKEFAEVFHYFEDGIIDLRFSQHGDRQMRLRMRMPPAISDSWHPFHMIGSSIVFEKEDNMVDAVSITLAGLVGAFAMKYTETAAKWLWEETAEIIERFQKRQKLGAGLEHTSKQDVALEDSLMLMTGKVPESIGLPDQRRIDFDLLSEARVAEMATLREEILVYQRRYLRFRKLVAEAGDYAEERDTRNLKESAEALEDRWFRLLAIVKSTYTERTEKGND